VRQHVCDRPPAGEHGAVEIDAQHAPPDVVGQFANALHVVHHARVVAEHIQAAVGADREIDQAFRRRLIGDGALCPGNRPAAPLDAGDGGIEARGVPVARDDAGALRREECSDR
jgi:hypothetical protein